MRHYATLSSLLSPLSSLLSPLALLLVCRPAWAVKYCPAAFNDADCVVASSVTVCQSLDDTYGENIRCDLTAAGASHLIAVTGYHSNDYSVWGDYGGETFCCHYTPTVHGFDYFFVEGSAYADTVKFTYTEAAEYNLEHSGAYLGSLVNLYDGDDTFNGSNATDSYQEVAGGENGNDTMTGGAGPDYLGGGAGDDTLIGGPGDDDLIGDSGADTIVGGLGDDWVEGGADGDLISGGAGDDTIDGGTGADAMCGDGGSDEFNDGDNSDESPLYDKFWDSDGAEATCQSSSTRKGGGAVTVVVGSCSSQTLISAPACP